MVLSQRYRGPDSQGTHFDARGAAALGHNRLSIIDLSRAGTQPMFSRDGRLCVVFNGEIYNYIELRAELHDYPFSTRTDTEVILAAYERWGPKCLDHFIGMFAFLIWDTSRQELFAARDRFGIKPLYYARRANGALAVASELTAFRAAGLPLRPDVASWSTYLVYGLQDHTTRTFWSDIETLPPGHTLSWKDGRFVISRWYDLADRIGSEWDTRPLSVVEDEYMALLQDAVRLRFRADVPIGINLSGGVDSSMLLGLVRTAQRESSSVKAYTFATGDARYDELPWVRQMLASTGHPSNVCTLGSEDVPELAARIQAHQLEPFGGIPTLAYARLFECARENGTYVLLDGQGMDEQWAGYDYYAIDHEAPTGLTLQGAGDKPVRTDCLTPEFREQSIQFESPCVFPDHLRNMQYRDIRFTKLPRALRFNDRVSMLASVELRAPFMDHRLFELALRQSPDRTIGDGTVQRKALLRRLARQVTPRGLAEGPKRALQTPQREWLRGDLKEWAISTIDLALSGSSGPWFNVSAVQSAWEKFLAGQIDNSFFVWQWISVGLVFDATQGTIPKESQLPISISGQTSIPSAAGSEAHEISLSDPFATSRRCSMVDHV
jgi:asparagine synthase (glutamine-hydrolysing)